MTSPDQGRFTRSDDSGYEPGADLAKARNWLLAAERRFEDVDPSAAHAAAMIGAGFVQLAAVVQTARFQAAVDARHEAERAADLERISAADEKVWAHQDAEAEVRTAVVEAHQAMTAKMQAEEAEIERRIALLGELDVATLAASGQRQERAATEARPHDGEPANLAVKVSELTSRIEDALSWLDEPDDASPEIQLAKIRAALEADRG